MLYIGQMIIKLIFVIIVPQDLCSMNMYDAGVSLSGFACFITPDLARDLANDVMSLVSVTMMQLYMKWDPRDFEINCYLK